MAGRSPALTDATPAFVPTSHTSTHDGGEPTDTAADELRRRQLVLAGREPEHQARGSWFRRTRSRLAETNTILTRLARIERAVELETLGERHAAIDKAKAEALAALIDAIKEQENAVVRMGAVIMVKANDRLVVRTLSATEAATLDRHRDLLDDPVATLRLLAELKEEA